jgi:homospermidine synthase
MAKFRAKFDGGNGSGRSDAALLLKLAKVPAKNITVMDFENKRPELKPWLAQGVKFVRDRITRENMDAKLSKFLKAGDLLVDLAWNIDCCEILQWCHDAGVLYVNSRRAVGSLAGAEKTPDEKPVWRRMTSPR